MNAGLPIVTTPVDGVLEQVVDGESALLYDMGDVAGLARHLSVLSVSRPAREVLANGALKAYGQFPSFETMTSQYKDSIDGLFRP